MAASRSIIFFADGSQETHTGLRRILHAQTAGSLLSRFLDRVKCALQEEVARVPPVDRNGLPDFHNLDCAGAAGALHCVSRWPQIDSSTTLTPESNSRYERADEPYPNATENVVVGVCFGELSAAAVSLAKSLVELIPLAVDSVRLAFRAGIAASVVGNGLERRTQPAQCWSTTVSRDCGLADEGKLDALGEQLGIPEHRRPYITAFSRKTITIGGPPSSLRRLLNYLRETGNGASLGTSRDIRIYAPYHAFRYFSREDVRRLVDGPVPSGDSFNDGVWQGQSRTFIGAATGKYYTATSRRELLEDVMYNILAQPIRWEEVVTACKLATEESKVSAWMVRPFAQSSLAKSLTSSLRAITDIQLTFDDAFGLQTTQTPRARHFPIAIVGMAGRFPKADDPDALWEVLKAGLDCHTEIPVDRFDPRTHLSQPAYGCFLDRPGMFDARFFNMSPREALQTDPGQRLALVTAYEALEMAGFVPNRTPSTQLDRVGTFNGQVADEYKEQNLAQEYVQASQFFLFLMAHTNQTPQGRINHFFKFGGPAVSLDTACSTSSVALHMACNAIWSGECDTAVVGGMNIISSSDNYVGLSAGHFISPTGGCKTWDKDADGYCRGEAVASVVLKPLEAAQADNDNVLGVILSFATNYSANADSITRPHAPTQESLYRTALRDAGLRPFDVDYIEMHGTGTQAGDTVEMNSVCNVFAPTSPVRPPDNPLYVGAVKANVGHGESASGITGLMKTLLVLRKQQLPPHVGIKTAINPKLPDLQKRNVHIPFHQTPLPSKRGQGSKRRILLNNFSAAGGNTACILEEPPERSIDSSRLDRRSHHVVTISGKSVTSVLNNARNLMAYLAEWPDVSLSDLSYTTTARRMHHPLRQAFVASSIAHLTEQLSAFLSTPNPTWPKKLSRVAFCFTGQGSFYMPMARDLFEHSSQFRQDLLRFDRVSREHCFATFLPVVDGSGADSTVTEVQKQLAIVAVEMALFRFFESLDISPSLVIGHSLGEYAALYAAGVLSANDTLYLVGQRASLLETSCPLMTSGMLAVQGGENTIKHLREKYSALEIACINGPRDVVLSGPRELCEAAMTQLRSQGVHCQLLAIPFAYHSSQMERILDRFEQMATAVHFEKPKVPLVSPSTETVVHEAGIIGPSYLRDQTRRCVRFYGALLQCEQAGLVDENTVWLEIGPRPICMGMIKATLGSQVRLLPSLREGENDWAAISKSLASLHTWGYDINWQEYHREFEAGKRLLTLPRYAWDEKEYWVPYRNDWLLYKGARNERAQTALSPAGPNTTTVQKLISQEVEDRKVTLVFETDLAESKMHAMITGHVINGSGLCPASVYADIALTIADYIRKNYPVEGPSSGISVGPMQILHPITLPRVFPQERKLLRMRAVADLATGKGTVEFGLDSRERGNDEPNAKCSIQYAESNAWLAKWSQSSYLVRNRIDSLSRGITEGTTHRILRGMAYKLFSSLVEYDRKYQGMQEVLINTEELEAVATLQLYSGTDAGSFFCNPLWIDSLMHLSGFIMNATDALDSRGAVFISHGWESFRLAREIDPSRTYRVHVKMQPLQGTVY
ncbi:Polyketide synthase, partial [Rasamsonia emersonii CBS 393.64]